MARKWFFLLSIFGLVLFFAYRYIKDDIFDSAKTSNLIAMCQTYYLAKEISNYVSFHSEYPSLTTIKQFGTSKDSLVYRECNQNKLDLIGENIRNYSGNVVRVDINGVARICSYNGNKYFGYGARTFLEVDIEGKITDISNCNPDQQGQDQRGQSH